MFGLGNLIPLVDIRGERIKDGDAIKSETNPDWIYRYENRTKRHYPNPEVANSWDNNWINAKVIKSADWLTIPLGVPMSKKTGFAGFVMGAGVIQNAVAPNPLNVGPLNPPVVVTETTPRTVNPNPTTPSVAKEVETVVVEEKLLGVKKPMAYYVYGGGLLLLIVVAYFIFKNK